MNAVTVKFLLVDDLDANLEALDGLLRRDGLELLKARSGAEALELLLVHDVALAVLDVQMPGMDGFELAELMRGTEKTRRVPIIFVTAGSIDQQRRFRGYEAGGVDFIFKPIEPHILRSKAGIFYELALQREVLRRTAEEAQAASRAKDDFLATLSHELRTPLTPVLMTASALAEDPELPPAVRESLQIIKRNVEIEARLIDDLLDITRITRGKLVLDPQPTDLHDLLRQSGEIVRHDAAERGVTVASELAAGRHVGMVDPTRLQQVFWNLIKNALKFTPQGGRVTVSTSNDPAGRIVITVRDTGVGISASALPRIFEAFEQGDATGSRRYGGLGLGLAISRAIVLAHDGSISVDSEGKDRGTTVTVVLASHEPFRDIDVIAAVTEQAAVALDVLLVEDHAETVSVFARLLTRVGHRVRTAGSVAEAAEAFAGHHFDVVISDLGLPDGSGLELMRSLQAVRPFPAIATSGYGTEHDLRRSREAGFTTHLVKPINVNHVRRLLAEYAADLSTGRFRREA